jgi:outer membrane murein-binding lipoprotein Lpp
MKKIFVVSSVAVLLGVANSLLATDNSAEIKKLEERIRKLKENSKTVTNNTYSAEDKKANRDKERIKARARMREDRKRYSRNQLKQIETLYQSRGYKYGSPEKTKNLIKVISTYSRANRAGCAMLYLGQFSSTGKKREYYLKKAINKYDDCFYGDGVQVGAYAMYWLAVRVYLKEGKQQEAYRLLTKLKAKYPDAIGHRGNRLTLQIDKILASKPTDLKSLDKL